MLELKILTPEDKFLSAVEFNYDELKNQLNTNLEKYQDLVFTEDNMKEGKTTRATLNKFKEAMEDKRKEVKKKCLEPYEAFEVKIKELVNMVDKPMLAIDNQVKSFENAKKEAKRQEIITYFTDNSPFGDLINLEHPNFWNEKWLNLTAKIEDVKNEIDQRIEHIRNGLENIDLSLESEFKPQIRDIFLKTFDLNQALAENKRLAEQKKREDEYKRLAEQKKREDEYKKSREELKKHNEKPAAAFETKKEETPILAKQYEITPEIVLENPTVRKWKNFSVEASIDEFVSIRKYLIDNDINYKFE